MVLTVSDALAGVVLFGQALGTALLSDQVGWLAGPT
jgi:hypothetical protein